MWVYQRVDSKFNWLVEGKILQENPIFHGKINGFRSRCSLFSQPIDKSMRNPILIWISWYNSPWSTLGRYLTMVAIYNTHITSHDKTHIGKPLHHLHQQCSLYKVYEYITVWIRLYFILRSNMNIIIIKQHWKYQNIFPLDSKHCLRRHLTPSHRITSQSYFLRRYSWIHRVYLYNVYYSGNLT